MSTYRIVRFYQHSHRQVVLRGLTLEQAQTHCCDPETCSSTCTAPIGISRTKIKGPWFDGYEEEK